MPANFVLDLVNRDAEIIKPDLVFDKLDYSRGFNTIGSLNVTITGREDPNLFERDSSLRLYRTPENGGTSLEAHAVWFVRNKKLDLATGDIDLKCVDQMDFLRRRLVGYRAETILADHTIIDGGTDPADDMMKEYVRENMGDSAQIPPLPGGLDTDRDLRPYLIVEQKYGLGPTVEEAASFKTVLDTLRSIHDTALGTDGTRVYFDIRAKQNGIFEFRTLIGTLGVDHELEVGGLVFSPENGTLAKTALEWDWTNEETFAYIGNGGNALTNKIRTVSGVNVNANHWNRIEAWLTGDELDPTVLDSRAAAHLYSKRPKIRLSANAVDTPEIIYGRDYFYGDSVWVQAGGYLFQCHIHAIRNRVSDGKEKLTISLVGELTV